MAETAIRERVSMLTSFDPRTGEVVGDFAQMGSEAVLRVVQEARNAQIWWAGIGFGERRRWLLEWKRALVRRVDELAELVSAETGKSGDDALIEVMYAVELLDWAARNAGRVLARRSLSLRRPTRAFRSSVGYQPYGVVGVLAPADYPVFAAMNAIAFAMAAGNAAVLKPSELTPAVGIWLAQSWQQLAPNQPVLHAVTGDARTGAALVAASPDKVSFTGSSTAARRVMGMCAQSLTPLQVTAGGKDAMLVAADAKPAVAADAAVFGAMHNAGQAVASVNRVYVVEAVYDTFVTSVIARAAALRTGGDDGASYGPLPREAAVDVVRRHVDDALLRGARAVVGGSDSFRDPYIEPIVLVDVPEDSLLLTTETFGPVLVVNRVRSLDEAVAKVNAGSRGTAVSVFTRDTETGRKIAERLRTGVVTINSVFSHATIPAVPMGGVGDSGFGSLRGDAGLHEFARPLSVIQRRRRTWPDLLRLDRKPRHLRIARLGFNTRHRRKR